MASHLPFGHEAEIFSSKFLFGNKTNHFSLADSLPASENREIETLYQKTNSSQGRLARAYIRSSKKVFGQMRIFLLN